MMRIVTQLAGQKIVIDTERPELENRFLDYRIDEPGEILVSVNEDELVLMLVAILPSTIALERRCLILLASFLPVL